MRTGLRERGAMASLAKDISYFILLALGEKMALFFSSVHFAANKVEEVAGHGKGAAFRVQDV